MKFFSPLLLLFAAHFFLFSACQSNRSESVSPVVQDDSLSVDSVAVDSDALVLSMTPTVGCLPFFYAQKSGIYKNLGVKVRLETYASQFDCDTAMLGTTAIGGSSDLLRLHYYAYKGKKMTVVSSLDGQWNLVAAGDLRLKKIPLLSNRMIAVARFSASDFYSGEALKSADVEYSASFRPQINDYYLRSSMLKNHQIDAAILPEPFATLARLAGHKVLYRSDKDSEAMGCLMFKPSVVASEDSLKMVGLLLSGYNQAVNVLNKEGKSVCADILVKDFKMNRQVVDSLVLPKYRKARMPSSGAILMSKEFLSAQNRWNSNSESAVLFNEACLPK